MSWQLSQAPGCMPQFDLWQLRIYLSNIPQARLQMKQRKRCKEVLTNTVYSGVGSDFLVRSLHASRIWCLFVASVVFLIAQVCALNIENPRLLGFVSGLSGLGYGFLFGVFPSLVTEAFGIRGLSQNWGFMTLAPVISSNTFNLLYGQVLDAHSVFDPSGERSCHDGLECYRVAYWATLIACTVGIAFTLWTVQHEQIELARERRKANGED